MLDRGVFLAPSQFEALFVSSAHTDADIDRTIAACRESLRCRIITSFDGESIRSPALVGNLYFIERKLPGTPAHKTSESKSTRFTQKERDLMPDELSELQENAEHGRENPSLAPISVTMAILAVCVAVVSLLGHRSHTEEL